MKKLSLIALCTLFCNLDAMWFKTPSDPQNSRHNRSSLRNLSSSYPKASTESNQDEGIFYMELYDIESEPSDQEEQNIGPVENKSLKPNVSQNDTNEKRKLAKTRRLKRRPNSIDLYYEAFLKKR